MYQRGSEALEEELLVRDSTLLMDEDSMSVSARQSGANATGIVVISACLMTIGLVMVASAGASLENSIITLQFWKTAFGRQAMFSVIGFVVLLISLQGYASSLPLATVDRGFSRRSPCIW